MISVGDLFARVANVNMTDTEAEQLIEDAILRAAVEIRERARQARIAEKNLYASHRDREAAQAVEGKSNQERWEREAEIGRERNRILKAAEDLHGPRRR